MVEVESCPRCGALPCDWTDNPHHPQPTGDVGALVERLRGHKCPECKGWGEVAYFGGLVACKCNGHYEAPITMATREQAAATILALAAEVARKDAALRGLYDDMVCLINDSAGVYGLHLNGDPAEWGDLLSGGRFEEWLGPAMDNARAAIGKAAT